MKTLTIDSIHRTILHVCIASLFALPGGPLSAECPADCPPPADPTGLDCSSGFRNCIGTIGNVTSTSQRTGIRNSQVLTCDSCNSTNKGSVSATVGKTTHDTSWSVNLPYGIGAISGGNANTSFDLSATLNCQNCKKVRATFYVYNVTVTHTIPYTLVSKTGFWNYSCFTPWWYTLVTSNCPGPYSETTTSTTLEGELGASADLACPPQTSPPCGTDGA